MPTKIFLVFQNFYIPNDISIATFIIFQLPSLVPSKGQGYNFVGLIYDLFDGLDSDSGVRTDHLVHFNLGECDSIKPGNTNQHLLHFSGTLIYEKYSERLLRTRHKK